MERLAAGVILLFILVPLRAAEAPQSWEFRDGAWVQVTAPEASTRPVAEPELDRIERLIQEGRNRAGFKASVRWLRSNLNSESRARGLFLAGEALFGFGNRIKAFYYYDELMDTYPDSRLFYPALERQFRIASDYLNGYRRRLLGMAVLDTEDEAVEMLYRIQQRSPGSQLAEKALLTTADHYFDQRDFELAYDAYDAYAKQYPRSPVYERVKLQQAFASLAQFRGVKFDGTNLIDARSQLSDYIINSPEKSSQENIPTIIENIDKTFARKLYYTADFYRRTHEPEAAVYTYRYLINAYPESPEASQAKNRLDKMPEWAIKSPEPAPGGGYAPTTQPGDPTIGP